MVWRHLGPGLLILQGQGERLLQLPSQLHQQLIDTFLNTAWRTGGLEDWRIGVLEDWRTGGLEAWRTGGLED